MNLPEYTALVESMRQAQKDYFATRSPAILQRAKDLERQVDTATLTLTHTSPAQPALLALTPAEMQAAALLAAGQQLSAARAAEDMAAFWKAIGQIEAAVRGAE